MVFRKYLKQKTFAAITTLCTIKKRERRRHMIEMTDIEALIDFDELFTDIWSAVEYGNDKEQYKEQILALCIQVAKDQEEKAR